MNAFTNSDRILIIGGTGFIGRHLVIRCLKDTPLVTCVALSKSFNNKSCLHDLEVLHADISNKEQIKSVLCDKPFDYVLNLSGYIDHTPYFKEGRKTIESHFMGLMNLIDSLDIKSLKGFVQIGSSDEYGDATAPQNERVREAPIAPYSAAKTAATHLVQTLARTENFPGVVVRLFLVYGPGQDDRRFLPQIIKACLKDEAFKTSEGKQIRDFCYVEDVVDAMIKAVLTPEAKGQVINVASGIPISIREMIENVVELIGGGRPLWGSLPYRTGENMELYADINLAKSSLQWEPQTSLTNGLEKTVEYYRNL
jgi:nucleoside-diphosphate-sugar epimerase